MITKIRKFIEKHNMIVENDRVVAGVSGGADSMCLLFVLCEIRKTLPMDLRIVHVEHGIRGQESKEDASFVKSVCEGLGIPFKEVSIDCVTLSKEWDMTVEEAGRTARYQAFLAENPDKIAVAHHQNDVAETMLFHLFRGTGIKGLASIAPVRDQIIRPLLCVSRNEIEQYMQEHKVSYRIDATNALNDYSRNRIRNEMIPKACMINEKAVHHMCETAELLRETENYMTQVSEKAFANYVKIENNKKLVIDGNLFEKEEIIISMYVVRKCFQILCGKWKDITAVHLKKVLELGRMQSGKQFDFPYGIHATKSYQTILLEVENKEAQKEVPLLNLQIPRQGEILLPGGYLVKTEIIPYTKNSDIPKETYTKCFDYDKIKDSIVIRTRQTGDYIAVNQSLGTQKLKTFYINNKIPLEKRDTIFLFAEGNHILWIVGYRISEEYKISDSTKRMWRVEIHHLQKENRNE